MSIYDPRNSGESAPTPPEPALGPGRPPGSADPSQGGPYYGNPADAGGPFYGGQGSPYQGGPGGAYHGGSGGGPYYGDPGGPYYGGPAGAAGAAAAAGGAGDPGAGQPNYGAPGGPYYGGPTGPNYGGPGGPNYGGPTGPTYGGPGGPYYGYPYGGYGGDGGGGGSQRPRGRIRRLRRGTLIAAVALTAGLGTFFALGGASGTSTGAVLTTAQITEQTDPGLVDVASTLGYEQAESLGTGLVLTSSGEVLTNNHVIEGATSITVTDIGNGQSYKAKVVGYNQTKDIAVLQLQGASGLKTVRLGDSSTAAVGQNVTAIGNAGGKGGTPSVVTGEITALNASITASDEGSGTTEQLSGMINDNAPIQAGDSGGPLVDSAGQVIGIDTAASTATGFQFQSQQNNQTQAFAIPINEALSIASQIERADATSTVHIGATGFLGVEVMSASSAARNGIANGSGAAVEEVLQGTPAANAGLSAGDVITSVDGRSVSSPSALQAAMERHHPGDRVRIGYTDQYNQNQSASLTLANGPAA
jgi:S1-C subfamily serine protease